MLKRSGQTNKTAKNINDDFILCVSVQYCIKVERKKESLICSPTYFPLF